MSLIYSKKLVLFSLMKLVQILILFNSFLIVVGIHYSYVIVIFTFLLLSIILGVRAAHLSRYTVHLLYIVLLSIICLLQFVFVGIDISGVTALGIYIMPIICWVVFYSLYGEKDYKKYFIFSFKLSIIISSLGIIQFLFSPQLFGLIPNKSLAMQWAGNLSFSEYASFFRATSTLGSPQVFGLYCSLMIIIGHRYRHEIPRNILFVGFTSLLLGGGVSGNKLFILILFLYGVGEVFPIVIAKLKNFFIAFIVIVSVLVVLPGVIQKIPVLERMFSIESMVAQEGSDSRLDKYVYIIQNTDPLLGNGLGVITNKRHGELRAAESYIFKIYYEVGIFGLLTLLFLMGHILLRSLNQARVDAIILVCIFISMLVVHAFESPVFFVIWGYILSINSVKESSKPYEYKTY